MIVARQADLSRSRPPRWAWQDRVVIGYLNLLIGNEGIGKGTFAAWLIARLTRGDLPGDLRGKPIRVGIVGDEDNFDDVWTPRLHVAGADLPRVVSLERPDGFDLIDVRADHHELAERTMGEEITLLYFDQLLDNITDGTDGNGQKPIRDALRPLRALARSVDVATLCSLHPNKHRAGSFRELVAVSAAFNALSRSSLLLAEHPENPERRVLVRGKGNLSRTPTGIEFEIASRSFTANGHTFDVPTVADLETGDFTVDDLIDAQQLPSVTAPSKVGDACDLIGALLPRDGEWHPSKPIFKACEDAEIDERTVQRAKKRLTIEHRRATEFPAGVSWRWPTPDSPTLLRGPIKMSFGVG